ncbi:MAG TPA: FtsQ-type POTRA domain-containing protein [Candidatus Sulfotelmatobacter sp.]|nr:FtsQ-type POTRA domain-containing protein [Candidatus Sulfotelmatobacter sp.]
MARKASGTILQEELYPASGERSRESQARDSFSRGGLSRDEMPREPIDDARLIDLDVDEESPFLRAQKRVSVRRSSLPKKAANKLLWASIAAAVLCAVGLAAAAVYRYGERSWRFRVDSSDNIELIGSENVTKAQIMEVMGADIGRNIFFIPLAQQKSQLEQIPWVESASVMRFVPNRLKVVIHERTPVAFARVGPRIELIDAGGTLMELPKSPSHNHKYSFPVILGMNPGEPLSTRAPRMKAYAELVRDLDAGGARYSQDLSEVDLSELDDLKVRVNDPAGDVLVHLGSSDYLKRYKIYVSHVQEWRQQFQKLESVNLRYDNQVIVNPDMEGAPKQAQLTLAAAKAAAAAGVKPAALVTRVGPHDRALPKPVFELSEKKLDPKAAAKKPAAKAKIRKKALQVHAKKVGGAAVPAAVRRASSPAAGAGRPRDSRQDAGATVSGSKTASGTGQKPSPAIAKQQGNTGPN